jgi:hypothetical protein
MRVSLSGPGINFDPRETLSPKDGLRKLTVLQSPAGLFFSTLKKIYSKPIFGRHIIFLFETFQLF